MSKAAPAGLAPAAYTRAAAARAVAEVLGQGRYLDTALESVRAAHGRSALEPALLQELAFGTLRWYHQLAGVAALFLARPLKAKDGDVYALLLIGLYQLRHMRVADHAAVDTTVAAADVLNKSWAKGLINACLRAAAREQQRVDLAVMQSEELRYSHPAWFIAAVQREHPQNWQRLLDANNARPPMTLRVNVRRTTRDAYLAQLQASGLSGRAHARAATAIILETPVPVDRLPGFAEGQVSVQDAAAQLAAPWLDAQANERVLDACAAPGGKAAHILEQTPTLAELVALDVDAERLERTRAGMTRLRLDGRLQLGDAREPGSWWDGRPFDRILVDVPCSATGVIRRHPDIKVRRQPQDLAKLTASQAEILNGVWPCLRRGGKLLYVTCSVLPEENETQVQDFLARHPDAVATPLTSTATMVGSQILTGEDQMDGFYYACLCKT